MQISNEAINQTDDESLSDLPISQEKAEDTKGGADDVNLSLNYQSIRFNYTSYDEKH